MGQKERGLFKKYNVSRTDKQSLKGGCIVLEFGSRNTGQAILQFADSVEEDGYGLLAKEIRNKLDIHQPYAHGVRSKKQKEHQAAIDALRRNMVEDARCYLNEIQRVKTLLAEAHELNGRLVHQMDRAGFQPVATGMWRTEKDMVNNSTEAPAKQGRN